MTEERYGYLLIDRALHRRLKVLAAFLNVTMRELTEEALRKALDEKMAQLPELASERSA